MLIYIYIISFVTNNNIYKLQYIIYLVQTILCFVISAVSLQFEIILAVPRPYSGHHLADSFCCRSTMVKLASVAMSEKGSTN